MDFDAFVLAACTADLAAEPAARGDADAVEFRMDLAADPLEALGAYDGRLPLIATNRVEAEGGGAPDTTARLDVLREAAAHPAVAAIDVELAATDRPAGERVLDAARDADTAVIASAHDFDRTPSRRELDDVLERAADVGDVGKLAVTATGPGDVLRLLAATLERDDAGDAVATMAMGEPGRHSRAVAPLYGSRVGYAPVHPEDATAPGQFDLATLRSLIDRLGAARRARAED